jgi:hypothetical protein
MFGRAMSIPGGDGCVTERLLAGWYRFFAPPPDRTGDYRPAACPINDLAQVARA